MASTISVIVPTLNGGPLFRQLLEGIMSQEIDAPVEVVVVDSGSTDGTVRVCSDYEVNLIQIPSSSFSHGATRNMAISAASGDICVLTVQDAVPVDRGWLEALAEPMRLNKRLAGVFGRQVSFPGTSSLGRCCKRLWYQEWRQDWRNEREQYPIATETWERLSPEEKRKAARFDNVNSCIRKSVWKEVPFPDVPYAEDIAWAIDVLTAGYSIYWQPEARMYHSHERPLSYELKRSYVDMKNLAAIFGESSPGLGLLTVRTVFDWLDQEARQFLDAFKEAGTGNTSNAKEVFERVDELWQRAREKSACCGADSVSQSSLSHRLWRIKNTARHRYYQSLSGPRWLRALCRNRLFGGRRSIRSGNHEQFAGRSFLLELRGRHRFLLNQLLRIYFGEEMKCRNEIHSIRLGAAAMVAGSMLGQYSAALADADNQRQSFLCNDTLDSCVEHSFWKLLRQWRNHEWNSGDEGLAALDGLLTAGV